MDRRTCSISCNILGSSLRSHSTEKHVVRHGIKHLPRLLALFFCPLPVLFLALLIVWFIIVNFCSLILILICISIVFEGPVAWTEKTTETGLNWTSGCSYMLFKMKKTTRNHPQPDWLQSVAIWFRYSTKIRTFWAYFEEKQARNACARAKTICYGKIRLCAMSCSCIF